MKILLVDISSIAYPLWHISGKEPDQDFVSTATVAKVRSLSHGFDHVAVCCDSPKSFRKDISPEYKAQRESNEVVRHQLRLAQDTLRDDGYAVWQADGFEGDDIIASADQWLKTCRPTEERYDVTIGSSDKDLMARVSQFTRVKSMATGAVYGPAEVKGKFGVLPEQIRDWLILVGDKSDGVRGVPGIGAVRAAELLNKHGTLFEIYQKLGDSCAVLGLTPSVYSALAEGVAIVELGRKLISLREDVVLPFEDIFKPRVPKSRAVPMTENFESKEQEANVGEVYDSETGEVADTKIAEAPTDALAKTPTSVETTQATPTTEKPKKIVQPPSNLAVVEWNMELEPRNPGAAVAFAERLFESHMFSGYGNPEAVLSTILLGRELGIGMMGSLRGIHNIKNKHALSADLMAALVLQSGKAKFFEPVKLTKESATYKTHRVGATAPFEMTFEFSEAVAAGLVKDDSGWKKWPIDMCKARVIARLARTVYPDVCFGLYVPEELDQDYREAA